MMGWRYVSQEPAPVEMYFSTTSSSANAPTGRTHSAISSARARDTSFFMFDFLLYIFLIACRQLKFASFARRADRIPHQQFVGNFHAPGRALFFPADPLQQHTEDLPGKQRAVVGDGGQPRIGMSSIPVMETSSGTRSPASFSAWITPRAIRSLAQQMAVGKGLMAAN